MVERIYVEKKPGLDLEAQALLQDARNLLGLYGLTGIRLLNRYDAEGLSPELFALAAGSVFSEPQLDLTYTEPSAALAQPQASAASSSVSASGTTAPAAASASPASAPLDFSGASAVFAVEPLPGQFDQRADSAAQCIQFLSQGERPLIRSARLYLLYGTLSPEDLAALKKYVINPVECREASLALPDTLALVSPEPPDVPVLEGFRALSREDLEAFLSTWGLAMDLDDLAFCQSFFTEEGRDPTLTEIRLLDTYWSDHCRHTTFLTQLSSVSFQDPILRRAWDRYLETRRRLGREDRPLCLMDLATIAARDLKARGLLPNLDESEEVNACTVKITVAGPDGTPEPWLLLFKNETHNHPTEIEPFGGAATCIGGAIRDPLSGRAYVYAAMRVTGAADPTAPVSATLPGKLPQRKIVTSAAAGYSSYGNQIGLATGIVDELYHPGYAAKRMEIGAVIAAAPQANVRREEPAPGDVVFLLGGATGRDGIGGATGSSKAHNARSVETCGAEVQKGNAPEERKLQRLFRNPEAARLIRRCNDFGAGGVSVAIGELAPGLAIDLSAVPRKYEGLDGTELAISESQERMAVVVSPEDAPAFLALAQKENLSAVPVARVTAAPRLTMTWRGKTIVDIPRDFLSSNGAPKHTSASPAPASSVSLRPESQSPSGAVSGSFAEASANGFREAFLLAAHSLRNCSRQGLSDRFDSTIGAGTVLMPLGGRHQLTPIQAMVHTIPLSSGFSSTVSFMAWGFNPYLSSQSPYHGAYLAVVESVCRLVATGAAFRDVYLTFQEYFEKPFADPARWGKPLAALLGAFEAQLDLGIAAIGGKDSMSGSFESLDVPPTLVSFAVTTGSLSDVVSPELKTPGHSLFLLSAERNPETGLPNPDSLKTLFGEVTSLLRQGRAVACYAPGEGGIAMAVLKMALGNGFGVSFDTSWTTDALLETRHSCFLLEMADAPDFPGACLVGQVTAEPVIRLGSEFLSLAEAKAIWEIPLESVFPVHDASITPTLLSREQAAWPAPLPETRVEAFTWHAAAKPSPAFEASPAGSAVPAIRATRPRVLIPAFPGTNCELDSARAVEAAGLEPLVQVIRNLTPQDIAASASAFAENIRTSQIIFIPGGFSGGDEPDGSAKFITAFFRGAEIREAVADLLERRDGLMLGICNGFQALIKLGLVPYGRIVEPTPEAPTLTFNTIGRHQSRIVYTRVASSLSPWLSLVQPGEVFAVPISHGEGRFLASETEIRRLAQNGQIATQYATPEGEPTMDLRFNPNGSLFAVEGITSPDGRVFGKMGHAERIGPGLYRNVPGTYDLRLFASAARYFR